MSNFKICSYCSTSWLTREDFITDPDIDIIGYQADFDNLDSGLFYFNHLRENCKTTLAITVKPFKDLYKGEISKKRYFGTEKCPGLCRFKDTLDVCPNDCECAYVREILLLIKNYRKKGITRDVDEIGIKIV